MSSLLRASAKARPEQVSRVQPRTVFLLIAAVLSLLLAEQVAAGWLPLGDRVNVSRRDFNVLEIVVIVLALAWGLFSLWAAARQPGGGPKDRVARYFDEGAPMPPAVAYGVAGLGILGLVSGLIAVQVATGWLPLGARTNIPRSDISWIEVMLIVLAAFWAVLCLRTVLGFLRRERPAWSWGQWALFLGSIVGAILLLSGIFDLPNIAEDSGSLVDDLAATLRTLAPGVILMASSIAGYLFLAEGYGAPAPQKAIVGTLSERARARDIRGAQVPAGQAIRNRLAASPGTGAIIGFLALLTFFSVATDLFLQPQSLAGALTNNITRGIVAIGATMLIISGELDLSVGSLVGIAGLSFLGLMTGQFPPGGPVLDPMAAAIVTLVFVGLLGSLNGWIVVKTGIPSFIVTLATMLMLRAIPLVFIQGGRNIRYVDYFNEPPFVELSRIVVLVAALVIAVGIVLAGRSLLTSRLRGLRARREGYATDPSDFRTLKLLATLVNLVVTFVLVAVLLIVLLAVAQEQLAEFTAGSAFFQVSFFDLANGRIASLPLIGRLPTEINLRVGVFWWFLLVLIFQFVLNQTRYGNATFATGGNAGAALAQGINVRRIKITNYILIAALAGVAGIVEAARLQSIDALRGDGLELEVIAATAIGGALLTGGYGSIVGALLGVFIFGMMQTGLVLIGVDARLFNAFIGAIILGAVIINTWSRRIRS